MEGTEVPEGTAPEGTEGEGNPTPPPQESEADRVKRENAQLRAQVRESEAKVHKATYGLTDEQFEELKKVNRDQQEDKAKAFAYENLKAQGGAGTPPEPPPPPPQEPENKDQLAALQSGGEAPSQVPAATKSKEQELVERINKAESYEDVVALQNELAALQRQ